MAPDDCQETKEKNGDGLVFQYPFQEHPQTPDFLPSNI
jgi:hypothetical protein